MAFRLNLLPKIEKNLILGSRIVRMKSDTVNDTVSDTVNGTVNNTTNVEVNVGVNVGVILDIYKNVVLF